MINKRRIEELMYERRITQADLAAAIGITPATLSRNINDINPPKADVLLAIAKYFNVSVEYLLGESDSKTRKIPDDEFQFALYDEIKDLTDEQKRTILELVKVIKNSGGK